MDLQRFFKNIMLRSVCAAGVGLLTLSLAPLTAKASDFDYNGEIDPFTGEPADDDYSLLDFGYDEEDSQGGTVWITDNCYYDFGKSCYVFPVDDQGGEISCSVADGMIVQNNVDFSATDGIDPRVYLNGNVIDHKNGQFTYAGSYIVTVMNAGEERQILGFTICGEMTNSVMGYAMPEGFDIISVSYNGEDTGYYGGYVDMSEEGRYYVSYECYQNGLEYALNLTVDITPPTLVLEGVNEKGRASGPVTIVNEDPDASISIARDGNEFPMVVSYVLTQSGKYVVTVTDKAGNSSEYQFIIMIYLDSYGVILLIILILIIIAVGVYIYYTRTHLKTR